MARVLVLRVACIASLLLSFVGAITINHGELQYSATTSLGKGDCNKVPSPCQNRWWIQNNEGGNAAQYRTTHTTSGPSASFSFTFHGSRTISIVGKQDSSVRPTVTLNGRVYPVTGRQEPELFESSGLSPNTTYNLEFRYSGGGFLNIAALLLDSNGASGPAQSPPPTSDPTSTPTTSSHSTPSSTSSPSDPASSSPSTSTSSTSTPGTSETPEESTPVESPGSSQITSTPNLEQTSGPSPTPSNDVPSNSDPDVHSPTQELNDPSGPGAPGKKPKAGVVAGAVVGAVLLLLLLLLGLWYMRRRMRARRAPSYAYRSGAMPWSPGNSNERVPEAWQGFPSAGTSNQNVTGHESFQAGTLSSGLPPSMTEARSRPLTRVPTPEDRVGQAM